ncbi:protein FAR-RED ELONGATED HYPOCOTYL 3 isoform X2 [Pyrus x bretschneideri]|uniref:protein FAR-RED ELONGATED HYPOCOTYL 3 isoform X2 n=1 Tax=Pyrus x bretschneideri TaxID=225117 RepID=UPI0005108C46|nr:protein FAR-RED ELONGATED HYPOCOTYL 3 isoform X2 [Pyrus x bretschneideri]
MEHRFDRRPRPWLGLIGSDPKSPGAPETSVERDLNAVGEPYVGMEFESEDAAKEFYEDYARRAGFIMRIGQCRRSHVEKRILSRKLSCNKQGGRSVKARDQVRSVRRPQPTTGEGCKAMMLVKLKKSGKWVITRVVKDHTHPLIVSSGNSMDAKDMKIAELTLDLEREEQLCGQYRELLLTLLNNVEEETEDIATKVRGVVNYVREFETQVEGIPENQMESSSRASSKSNGD